MAFCVLLSQNKKLKIDAFGSGFETFQDVQQKKAPEMVREELLHSLTESEGEGKPELDEAVQTMKDPKEAIVFIKRF